jgi:hypothetical protein
MRRSNTTISSGFQVSKPLLERTFPIVYGVELKDVLPHEDLAVGSYRFAVSRMIPQMTQIALRTHKKDMMKETFTPQAIFDESLHNPPDCRIQGQS